MPEQVPHRDTDAVRDRHDPIHKHHINTVRGSHQFFLMNCPVLLPFCYTLCGIL